MLSAYEWLMSGEGTGWLRALAEYGGDPLRLRKKAAQRLADWQAQLISQQWTLRARARQKFTRAEQMLFTFPGLEQATDERIARYKASRFPDGPLLDVCCGIGGDLIGLCHSHAVQACDRDAVACRIAGWNAQVYERDATLLPEPFDPKRLATCEAWHVDPDRRPVGRRTSDPQRMQPSAEQLLEWLAIHPHAAIKLAPAMSGIGWPQPAVREWIGRDGECQQQVVWTGQLAARQAPRVATVLEPDGGVHQVAGSGEEPVPRATSLGPMLFEPAAPVLVARLVGVLATRHSLHSASDDGGYLTGDEPVENPLLSQFRVIAVMPWRESSLGQWLRRNDSRVVEVKQRGTRLEANQLQRRLARGSSGRPLTLLLFSQRSQVVAVLGERLPDRVS